MRYYPAYLDVQDRHCLVVGGGQVGTRKVKMLMACGAKVVVVSPWVTDELAGLAHRGKIVLYQRAFDEHDLDHVFLVIGATDDQAVNRRIHDQAECRGRLCNIADQPHLCNFVLPSIVSQGDLTIAVSTSGQSPAFAKHLRSQLTAQFGPEYGDFLKLMGAIRTRLLKAAHAPEFHKPLFERLIAEGLLDMIKAGRNDDIDGLLQRVLGPGYCYTQLMNLS